MLQAPAPSPDGSVRIHLDRVPRWSTSTNLLQEFIRFDIDEPYGHEELCVERTPSPRGDLRDFVWILAATTAIAIEALRRQTVRESPQDAPPPFGNAPDAT